MHSSAGRVPTHAVPQAFNATQSAYLGDPGDQGRAPYFPTNGGDRFAPGYSTQNHDGPHTGMPPDQALPQHNNFYGSPAHARITNGSLPVHYSGGQMYRHVMQPAYRTQNYPPNAPASMTGNSCLNQPSSPAYSKTLDVESLRSPQSIVSNIEKSASVPSISSRPKTRRPLRLKGERGAYVPRSPHHFIFRSCFLTRKAILPKSEEASSIEHRTSRNAHEVARSNTNTKRDAMAIPPLIQMPIWSPETNALPSSFESNAHRPVDLQTANPYAAQTFGEATGQNDACQNPRDPAPMIPQNLPLPSPRASLDVGGVAKIPENLVPSKIDDTQSLAYQTLSWGDFPDQLGCQTSAYSQDVNTPLLANHVDQTQADPWDSQNSETSTASSEAFAPSLSSLSSATSISANQSPISDGPQETEDPASSGGAEQTLMIVSTGARDPETGSSRVSELTPGDSRSVPPPIPHEVGRKRRRAENSRGDGSRVLRRSSRITQSSCASTSVFDSEATAGQSWIQASGDKRQRRNFTGRLIDDSTGVSRSHAAVPAPVEKSASSILSGQTEQATSVSQQRVGACLDEPLEFTLARAPANLLDDMCRESANSSTPDGLAEQAECPIQDLRRDASSPVSDSLFLEQMAWDVSSSEVENTDFPDLIPMTGDANDVEGVSVPLQENPVYLIS